MPRLALFAGYVIVLFLGALGAAVIWYIFRGRIDLRMLVSEKDGPASMSRFQFLIFTFVVAMCLLVLTIDSGEFPQLSPNILGLLGISGGSYLVSKGIQREGRSGSTAASGRDAGRSGGGATGQVAGRAVGWGGADDRTGPPQSD